VLALAFVLSACNGGGGSTQPPLSGEADKSAEQIVADSQAAMTATRTFRVTSENSGKSGSDKFAFAFDEQGGFSGTVDTAGVHADVVVVDGQVYIKGRQFWAKVYGGSGIPPGQLQIILSRIADHWAHDPADVLGLLQGSKQLIPADVPDCMGVHGKLSKGGTDTFNGQRVDVVNDDGSQPGGMPGRYLVADAAPHRLLHADSHGPQTVGTPPAVGKCPAGNPIAATDVDPTRKTAFTFSDFESVKPVSKPADTVEIAAG
jgi:hypothetical protein